MSSKILELLRKIDEASSRQECFSVQRLTDDLRVLLAAPVVERQPITDSTFIRGWKVGTKYFGLRMEAVEWIRTGQAAAHGEDTKLMPLYFENHPPELAELQATIERLTAENERLKSVTNFKDAVACVFDNLKMTACNTSDRTWDDRLEDLAEDVIDCLLYTSPSPRDLSTSRMPSSA